MNTSKCPVAVKVMDKMVSRLQDILVLLDAGDKEGRLDFLRFRAKTVKQYGVETFHDVLKQATGGLNVKGIYSGGTNSVKSSSSGQDRSSVPQTTIEKH